MGDYPMNLTIPRVARPQALINHTLHPSAKLLRKDSDSTVGSWSQKGLLLSHLSEPPVCVDRRGGTVLVLCRRFGTGFYTF